jgi:hypothetical protein
MTQISISLFVIGSIVVLLFSIWVCGLVGIEQVSHYVSCQELLKDKEDTLAMYIEAEEQNRESIEKLINSDAELSLYKVDI